MKQFYNKKIKTAIATVILIGGLGMAVNYYPTTPNTIDKPAPKDLPKQTQAADLTMEEKIAQRFKEGAVMLHAKQYKYAITAFQWVLSQQPELPEANVNMGFAMLGLDKNKIAHDFFARTIEIKPTQANAYYGLAIALENMKDIEGARGAMRTFIHLSKKDNPYLPKARAALWVWEEKTKKQ
ncbi:MAG: hypothetical protein HQL69_01880 [Magnetococcales bacterium]|nr:hypothetical protein [Magnetococcales bacterium]